MPKKKEQMSLSDKICKENNMFFCPYCGSKNIRFLGFVMEKHVIFECRKEYFRCIDCGKKIGE